MDAKKKAKIDFALWGFVLVISGIFFVLEQGINPMEYVLEAADLVVVLIIVVGLWNTRKEASAGLPLKDELSRKMQYKTAYYTYLFMALSTIPLMMSYNLLAKFSDTPEKTLQYAFGIQILASALVNIVIFYYFKRKGITE